jgi:hypothetical protein
MPIFDTTAFLQQLLYDPKHPLLFNDGFFVFFFAIFIALYYLFRHHFPIRKFIFCAFFNENFALTLIIFKIIRIN